MQDYEQGGLGFIITKRKIVSKVRTEKVHVRISKTLWMQGDDLK